MQAANSSSRERTTNARESFNARFNASFYHLHQNTFRFLDVLKKFQVETAIRIEVAKSQR